MRATFIVVIYPWRRSRFCHRMQLCLSVRLVLPWLVDSLEQAQALQPAASQAPVLALQVRQVLSPC
jgi:hypothetical protein